MTEQPTITIPRHEAESARAYAARIEYVTMGPQRSIDKAAKNGTKTAPRYYKEWSRRYGWVESARQYDEQQAFITIQEAGAAYRADLEEHRKRYQQAGRALYGVAVEMLSALRRAPVEYTPAALSTIARALTTAGDLEAHALRIADLLPKLDDGRDSE